MCPFCCWLDHSRGGRYSAATSELDALCTSAALAGQAARTLRALTCYHKTETRRLQGQTHTLVICNTSVNARDGDRRGSRIEKTVGRASLQGQRAIKVRNCISKRPDTFEQEFLGPGGTEHSSPGSDEPYPTAARSVPRHRGDRPAAAQGERAPPNPKSL